MINFKEYLVLFLFGGSIYVLLEIIYRGYSHYSMFMVGGICFTIICSINKLPFNLSLPLQMLISCLIITCIELISGIFLNIYMKMNVWDYSCNKFNFLGQICLRASITWFFLSLPAIYTGEFIKSFFSS